MNTALRPLNLNAAPPSLSGAKYLLSYIVPGFAAFCLFSDSIWAWVAPIIAFVILPILELVMPAPVDNLSPDEEESLLQSRWYDLVVYSMVPFQLAMLAWYLYSNATIDKPLWLWGAHAAAMGLLSGIIGINVAHELGHRRSRFEQNLSKILLFTTLYMHFFIEHNRGHHNKVATADDPASARYGEWLYPFVARSIIFSWLDAWKLEATRLRAVERPIVSWHNEMLRFTVYQTAAVAAVFVIGGPWVAFSWLASAFLGILLLEVVNYLEHYGLSRQQLDNGRYERVQPVHSWNSNHLLGRMLLFELTRHSDHHANARRRYQILRHFDESPQLPTGYPGMMVLATIPPLWFAVMHPHIERYRQRATTAVLR